jgi:hypothetical protein
MREAQSRNRSEKIAEATGIDRQQLERVAGILISSQRPVFCWGMGLTQCRHAVVIGEHQFAADHDRIRDAIVDIVPGCADYNARVQSVCCYIEANDSGP